MTITMMMKLLFKVSHWAIMYNNYYNDCLSASPITRSRYHSPSGRPQSRRYAVYSLTLLYFTLLYFTLLYFTLLYFTLLYFTLLYFTLLYFTLLYFTLLYFTLLYFTLVGVVSSDVSRSPLHNFFHAMLSYFLPLLCFLLRMPLSTSWCYQYTASWGAPYFCSPESFR